jgi:hypothetical protein
MIIGIKPAAISQLRQDEARLKVLVKELKEALTAQLYSVVPASLKKWADEECFVIRDLLEHGHAGRKYYDDDQSKESFGFTSLQEFGERFEDLQKAWAGIVDIVVSGDGDRMEVYMIPAV